MSYQRRTATAALVPLAEIASEVHAVESLGNLTDFGGSTFATPDLVVPPVVDGVYGRGREFGDDLGLVATEVVTDSSRLTRDVTVRAFMTYEIANQSNGEIGTLCNRGTGENIANGGGDRRLFGVEFERVSATSLRVRARWDVIGGAAATIVGVTITPPSGLFQVAVVRRWISTTEVELDYVIDDELVGTETVTDGNIGEGDGGAVLIGCAGDGFGSNFTRFLPADSVVEFLSIESDAMSVEELRQEYRRIAIHEPSGGRILRAYEPPGKAWTREPSSRVQRLIAGLGDGLGFAIAAAARLREDYLPDRAYGAALAAWERITGLNAGAADSVQDRRDRVLGFLRKFLGFQLADVKDSLEPLFGLTAAQIEILEYDALRTDDFDVDDIATPPSRIWVTYDGAGAISVTAAGPYSTIHASSSDDVRANSGIPRRVASISAPVEADVDGATIITGIDLVTAPSTEYLVGHVWQTVNRDALVVGRYLDGATAKIGYVTFVAGVQSAVVELATPASAMADPIWLLSRYDAAGLYSWNYNETAYDSAALEAGAFTPGLVAPRWAGFGLIGISGAALTAAADVRFSDAKIYEPGGLRAFAWQAYRNTALGGTYDLEAAQAQLQKQRPAHTEAGAVIDKDGIALGPTGTGRLGVDPLYPANQIVT